MINIHYRATLKLAASALSVGNGQYLNGIMILPTYSAWRWETITLTY